MAMGWTGREQRRSPRIEVLKRVKGTLVPVGAPIIMHDLSRTGFAVVSHVMFKSGDELDFQLVGEAEAISISARAVHSRAYAGSPNLYLTGFEFVPGELTGMIPQSKIDRLLEAVSVTKAILAS